MVLDKKSTNIKKLDFVIGSYTGFAKVTMDLYAIINMYVSEKIAIQIFVNIQIYIYANTFPINVDNVIATNITSVIILKDVPIKIVMLYTFKKRKFKNVNF